MRRIGRGPGSAQAIKQSLNAATPDWGSLKSPAGDLSTMAKDLAKADPPRGSKDSWKELTEAFAEQAAELDAAVAKRDRKAAQTAIDALSNSCNTCHRAHRGGPGGPGGGPPGGGFGGPPGGGPPGGGRGFGGPTGSNGGGNGEGDAGGPAETPEEAVKAFLAALKAGDAKALAATVSPRAPAEVSLKAHKKTFESILGTKLSTAELQKIAADLDGYKVDGKPSRTATGKVSVPLANGDVRRKVFVRHDRDGWRVVDYSGKVKAAK
jgi:hypothetical protein